LYLGQHIWERRGRRSSERGTVRGFLLRFRKSRILYSRFHGVGALTSFGLHYYAHWCNRNPGRFLLIRIYIKDTLRFFLNTKKSQEEEELLIANHTEDNIVYTDDHHDRYIYFIDIYKVYTYDSRISVHFVLEMKFLYVYNNKTHILVTLANLFNITPW